MSAIRYRSLAQGQIENLAVSCLNPAYAAIVMKNDGIHEVDSDQWVKLAVSLAIKIRLEVSGAMAEIAMREDADEYLVRLAGELYREPGSDSKS